VKNWLFSLFSCFRDIFGEWSWKQTWVSLEWHALMEHVRNVNGQSVIHHDDGCVCVYVSECVRACLRALCSNSCCERTHVEDFTHSTAPDNKEHVHTHAHAHTTLSLSSFLLKEINTFIQQGPI